MLFVSQNCLNLDIEVMNCPSIMHIGEWVCFSLGPNESSTFTGSRLAASQLARQGSLCTSNHELGGHKEVVPSE